MNNGIYNQNNFTNKRLDRRVYYLRPCQTSDNSRLATSQLVSINGSGADLC